MTPHYELPQDSLGDVVTALLADSSAATSPQAVVSLAVTHSPAERWTARLRREYSDGLAVLSQRDELAPSLPRRELAEAVASAAIRLQRNVLFEGEAHWGAVSDTLAYLRDAGHSVRVVLIVDRQTDAALARVTQSLRAHSLGEAEQTRGADGVDLGVGDTTVDRYTVVDGDGATVYDGPTVRDALRAMTDSRAAAMSGLQAVSWLSELRRVTEHVTSSANRVPRDILTRTVQLYDLAVERVLPEMPIRTDSPAATVQRQRLAAGRARVQALIDGQEQERTAAAAPPEPSGPSL